MIRTILSPGRAATPLVLMFALAVPGLPAADRDDAWPQFRGVGARGVADGHPTAQSWSVNPPENIEWRTPVPGLGHSAPVVWGDRLFVTTSVSGKAEQELRVGLYGDIGFVDDDSVHRFELHALDARTGKVLWSRTAAEGVPKIKRHTKASHANSTPATDGKRVVAMFGSEGLYAYDSKGKLLWKKDLGLLDSGFFQVPEAQWGFGSSPVIHDGKVFLQVDVQGDSFLAAYDVRDGKELWRTPREEVPTWGSPTVHTEGSRTQVVVNGWKHIGGYDAADGKELWKMTGGGDIPTPTPYVAHDLIFLTNAHGGSTPVWAIRTDAEGDITLQDDETSNEHIVWSDNRGGSYMPTTLVYGDLLYVLRDNGVLTVREARTGSKIYQQRIGEGSSSFTASPVAADGKIYLTAESGDIYVMRAGREYELLATNSMDEVCMATPAISKGTMFWRTRGNVVAVAAPERKDER